MSPHRPWATLVATWSFAAGVILSCGGGGGAGTGRNGTGGGAAGAPGAPGTGGGAAAAGRDGAGGTPAGTTGGSDGSGTGGAAGTGGTAGTGGRGSAGEAGGRAGGGAGRDGAAGSGAGGGSAGHGSAGRFICPGGVTYGNPLAGIGAVTSIAAPPADTFNFIEGPVWIASLSTLFFSDNASTPERIFKLVPPSTVPALFVADSGSNGLGVDNSDLIIAADQRNKRIVRFDPHTGQMVGTPISTGAAKPNDVIARSDGNVYFTDPDSGFYRISPAGTVSAVMKLNASNRPNGIELSPDEGTLYVGDVSNRTIAMYTLGADGTVMTATGTSFVKQTMNSTVDGMCVDCAGNVYAGTSGGIEVYSSAGTYIGVVPTGSSSNCTFGGPDRRTMYVTSRTLLKYATLNVPGLPD